ncbi:MAG: hypothetical protein IPH09_13240 [bacterium]|nr:hypothetical protein [bacterium]
MPRAQAQGQGRGPGREHARQVGRGSGEVGEVAVQGADEGFGLGMPVLGMPVLCGRRCRDVRRRFDGRLLRSRRFVGRPQEITELPVVQATPAARGRRVPQFAAGRRVGSVGARLVDAGKLDDQRAARERGLGQVGPDRQPHHLGQGGRRRGEVGRDHAGHAHVVAARGLGEQRHVPAARA